MCYMPRYHRIVTEFMVPHFSNDHAYYYYYYDIFFNQPNFMTIFVCACWPCREAPRLAVVHVLWHPRVRLGRDEVAVYTLLLNLAIILSPSKFWTTGLNGLFIQMAANSRSTCLVGLAVGMYFLLEFVYYQKDGVDRPAWARRLQGGDIEYLEIFGSH